MPADPFADDPNDPARLLSGDAHERVHHCSDEERPILLEDLQTVEECAKHLPAYGIKGIVFICEDCSTLHFYEWDAMRNHILAALNGGVIPVHEPKFSINEDEYAPWEYVQGFLDGLLKRPRSFF